MLVKLRVMITLSSAVSGDRIYASLYCSESLSQVMARLFTPGKVRALSMAMRTSVV